MTAEELKAIVERLKLTGDIDDQARLTFYTLQALAIIAEQLTRVADGIDNLESIAAMLKTLVSVQDAIRRLTPHD